MREGRFKPIRWTHDSFSKICHLIVSQVVLSACSPFFRSVLKQNPHPHPLLYLKGVKHREILSILSFIYEGEVNVAQTDLGSFLGVAEDLQVKGLSAGGQPQQNGLQNNNKDPPDSIKVQPKIERDLITEDVVTPAQNELLVVDVDHDPIVASDNEMEDNIIEYPIDDTISSFQHSSFQDTFKSRLTGGQGKFLLSLNFKFDPLY